jgi:tetrahydromethanopterin S-methyltransferase subunit G
MFDRRRRRGDVEEVGIIRRTLQDVLVPEMQAIKERLAVHDEKFVSIDRRFDQVERRLDALDKTVADGFTALRAVLERIESRLDKVEVRLQFVEFDKRLYRLELLHEHGSSGPKTSDA